MSFVNKQQANCKPNGASLEKFREEWLRRLVLHHGIKGSVLRVAIVLSYHINRQTGVAFPGVRTIRKLTGLSLSTISNAVNWLGASGYLDIQRGRTRNATNRYAPMFGRKSEHPVRPVRTPVFAPGRTDLPTYLPKEPPSYKAALGSAVANISAKRGSEVSGNRGSKGLPSISDSTPRPQPSNTVIAECYRLARDYQPEGGPALVRIALDGMTANDCLDEIRAAIDSGASLGEALWSPK